MQTYIPELNDLKFSDKELEEFFNKFNYKNIMDEFDIILYFSNFSGNMKELVYRLELARSKVYKKKIFDENKTSLKEEIQLLNKKELILLHELLDEVEMCVNSDSRYKEEYNYFEKLKDTTYEELENKILNKKI